MDERTAQCGCGRLKVRVRGGPLFVGACYCDFCQKHTGSAFRLSSFFREDQIIEITGDPSTYNGLEIDGVGIDGSDEVGCTFYFCDTCGSTVLLALGCGPRLLWHLRGKLRRSRFPGTDVRDLDRAPPPLARSDPRRRGLRTLHALVVVTPAPPAKRVALYSVRGRRSVIERRPFEHGRTTPTRR